MCRSPLPSQRDPSRRFTPDDQRSVALHFGACAASIRSPDLLEELNMDRIASLVKDHSLVAYFVLAYLFSWTMVALFSVAFVFALLALFGPALAAVLVTAF